MSKVPWKYDPKESVWRLGCAHIYRHSADEFWYAATERNRILGPYDNITVAMNMYAKWKCWYDGLNSSEKKDVRPAKIEDEGGNIRYVGCNVCGAQVGVDKKSIDEWFCPECEHFYAR